MRARTPARTRLLAAAALGGGRLACASPARAATPGQVLSDDITLTVTDSGTLRATETVTLEGSGVERSLVRLKHVDDRRDRRFDVVDVRGGTATADGDRTVLTPSGTGSARRTVKLTYTVRGTMTSPHGRQQLDWVAAGGWNVPVAQTKVTVEGGAAVQDLNCFAGELDSRVGCTQFFTNHTHVQAEFRQQELQPGGGRAGAGGGPPGAAAGGPGDDGR